MKKIRLIPRLDIKGPNVIKGIQLEGIRIVGSPQELAKRYYEQGADELLYIDVVASLYERENIIEIINKASKDIFIPLTVGGGVRRIEDIKTFLRAGADKVAINTAATRNPRLITQSAKMFGSQCIVVSIEAKSLEENKWEAYIENGRERTGLDVLEWAKEVEELGAGEILLTSVDKEGTNQGYDIKLINKISSSVQIPIIACGGAGNIKHMIDCAKEGNADAIALASMLHYNKITIPEIKKELLKSNIKVRLT